MPVPNDKISAGRSDESEAADEAGERTFFFFSDLDEPEVEKSADMPEKRRRPAFSRIYRTSSFSFCSCIRHNRWRRCLSACNLLSGVCFRDVLFIGFIGFMVIGNQCCNYGIQNESLDFILEKNDSSNHQKINAHHN